MSPLRGVRKIQRFFNTPFCMMRLSHGEIGTVCLLAGPDGAGYGGGRRGYCTGYIGKMGNELMKRENASMKWRQRPRSRSRWGLARPAARVPLAVMLLLGSWVVAGAIVLLLGSGVAAGAASGVKPLAPGCSVCTLSLR